MVVSVIVLTDNMLLDDTVVFVCLHRGQIIPVIDIYIHDARETPRNWDHLRLGIKYAVTTSCI